MKRFCSIALIIFVMLASFGCSKSNVDSIAPITSQKISVVDDSGEKIVLEKPAVRIISLYSAHTENLFALNLDKEIIGVSMTEDIPQAKQRQVFDYRADPEKVIAAEPDLVIIRPFIAQGYPNFVKALKNAGIKVVTLYPERFEDFDEYIKKLAILTGKEQIAAEKLAEFHKRLNVLRETTNKALVKQKVYFESTVTNYRTITKESMTAKLLDFAGAINIAADAIPLRQGSSIGVYGDEKLLDKADEIDAFIAQFGSMNPQVTPESIALRPGFDKIKAIRNNKVFVIDEKYVSRPTFDMADGAYKIAKMLYPELF